MKVYTSQVQNTNGLSGNSKSTINKDGFLRILTAQLQNQDPMNAKDNSEYVAQMAQFSALEQMQNLNASMNNLLLSQKVNEGNSMIGRVVTVDTGEGGLITGEVSAAKAGKNIVNIVIDNKEYNVDDVIEVKNKEIELENQVEPVTEGSEEDVLSNN